MNRYAPFVVLVALAALVAACAPQTALVGEGSAGVTGSVAVDWGKGTAAPGKEVLLLNARTGKVVETTKTNWAGQYGFGGVAPGAYLVRVGQFQQSVQVAKGDHKVNFDLSEPDGVYKWQKQLYQGLLAAQTPAGQQGQAGASQAAQGAPPAAQGTPQSGLDADTRIPQGSGAQGAQNAAPPATQTVAPKVSESSAPLKTGGGMVSSSSGKRRTTGAAPAAPSLLGGWVHEENGGAVSLVFESQDRLVYDGDTAGYTLRPGEIVVMQDQGPAAYPYVLKGSSLEITFPDGSRRVFRRARDAGGTAASGGGSPAMQAANRGLHQHFGGYWWAFSASSGLSSSSSGGKIMLLKPDGSYARSGQYSTSGGLSGGGSYGYASDSHARGRWTATGDKFNGVIRLVDASGRAVDVRYRVKSCTPQKFAEYYFNGSLYVYATADQLRYAGYGDAEIPR